MSYQLSADEDSRLNLEQLGSSESTSLPQFLQELLGTLAEDNKAADEDSRLNLEQLGSSESTSLPQFLQELLGTLAEDNKAADEDSRLNLEQLGSSESTSLPQFLQELLGTLAEDNKAGLTSVSYNPRKNIKETFYGNHPRIALLGRLLSKDRKQYKKRGNLSECFWKYCV
ncbi:hypothetical protein ASZ78_004990 [Callipepla squamata]|uniref:Urotensin-2 n=1 Tax=Callipepla squamata TaxID=9009 RepID=A0A226MWR0_CALSU|nr:hypothetical protein ASZ78_004990 [Callipepla squamata]